MKILSLLRPLNLLLILLTQMLMRFAILEPLLEVYELESQLPLLSFWLYVLATLFVAAGGYVVNDIVDYPIDKINKPQKLIIKKHLSEEKANNLFYFLYSAGLLSAIIASWMIDKIEFAFIHGVMAILLYYYTQELKLKAVIGNVVIAFAVAMVPLSIGLIEITLLNLGYSTEVLKSPRTTFYFQKIVMNIFYWILGFAAFAFLSTWAREIIKDLMDKEGDKRYGGKTFPIVYGEKLSKHLVILLYVVIITALIFIQQQYLFDAISTVYIGLLFVLFAVAGFRIHKAKNKKDYIQLSLLNKVISALGLGYALVAAYNFGSL